MGGEDLGDIPACLGRRPAAGESTLNPLPTQGDQNEGAHSDHMEDEWKERWRQERATERSVSEMFGSLTADRS